MVELKAARAADASFASYQAGVTARLPNLEEKTDDIASSLTTYETKVDANSAISTLRNEVNAQYGRSPASCLRPWGRLRIYATAAPECAVSRGALAAKATVESTTSTAAMFMYADGAGRNWLALQTDPFALAHGRGPNAQSSTPFYVQGDPDALQLANGAASMARSAKAATLSIVATYPAVERGCAIGSRSGLSCGEAGRSPLIGCSTMTRMQVPRSHLPISFCARRWPNWRSSWKAQAST